MSNDLTQGPWTAQPSRDGIYCHLFGAMKAQALTGVYCPDLGKIRAQVAPLIVEAPAMLAALRWCEQELTAFQNCTGTPDAKLAEIRAILARIDGAA
jgi:hypothetical protein